MVDMNLKISPAMTSEFKSKLHVHYTAAQGSLLELEVSAIASMNSSAGLYAHYLLLLYKPSVNPLGQGLSFSSMFT